MVYFIGKDGKEYPKIVTAGWLRKHREVIFIFGDNSHRKGKGGAAVVRDEPNTIGVTTKKYPSNDDCSFFKPTDKYFNRIIHQELTQLEALIKSRPDYTFLISPIGSGLANKYKIYEKVIVRYLRDLDKYKNVILIPKED